MFVRSEEMVGRTGKQVLCLVQVRQNLPLKSLLTTEQHKLSLYTRRVYEYKDVSCDGSFLKITISLTELQTKRLGMAGPSHVITS